jgi:hypothetical protein
MMDECKNEDTRWTINNAMKFWSACPVARCRRARTCVGDNKVCHEIFWPVVPEEMKVWWRAVLDAKRKGRTATQAGRAADAAKAECRKRAALMKKLQPK